MGVYLNPGNMQFRKALNAEIYVDKTNMILYLNSVINTSGCYMAVSRPRRFGKSLTINMISAYYDRSADSRPLFEGRKLSEYSNWDQYLGKFNVLRFTMTDFLGESSSINDMLSYLNDEATAELMKNYPDINYGKRISLRTVMSKIYAEEQIQFVIVIDEWDAVFREWQDDKEGQKEYLNFLRDWLKDKDYVTLAYMTGILPIKKYGQQSALNMFSEYSMLAPMQLAEYTGFTDQEVKDLCQKYNMSYQEISDWYDGYLVSDRIPVNKREAYREGEYQDHIYPVYCPLSVVSAMNSGYIQNYWNNTESYEALAEYIRMDYDGLKETIALLMDGGRAKIDTSSYQNDMTTFHNRDDILTMLIHLGYLGFDSDTREVFIPNKEILDVYKTSTKSSEWIDTFESFKISQELLKATWNQDEEKVAELLEKAHDRASNKTYNNEAALSYGIQYAYYAAQKYYTTILELDTGKGYADIAYLPSPRYPDKPAMVVELKYNQGTETALDQIRKRNYPERLEHYKGNILLVGINYSKTDSKDPDYKHHTCRIEKA